MKHSHRLPPVAFDIIFKFHTVLAVIIHGRQTVIYLAGLEHETILFGMGHYCLEHIFLLCHYILRLYIHIIDYKVTIFPRNAQLHHDFLPTPQYRFGRSPGI